MKILITMLQTERENEQLPFKLSRILNYYQEKYKVKA